jgi:hypothetical protein
MKYYIYILAVLLLALAAGATLAQASGASVDVPVPLSFSLSEAAIATDNGSNKIGLGQGPVEIIPDGQALFLWVPAAADNGTMLTYLNDPRSGIVFQNNTMHLPLYAGLKVGTLIVTTDNLTRDSEGYSGMITGLELDLAKITAACNGTSFAAGISILLKDLPEDTEYRASFTDALLPEEISADLEAAELSAAVVSPGIEVTGNTEEAADAVSFVIATVETADNWSRPYGSGNVTIYLVNGSLHRLPYKARVVGDGGVAYEAIAPDLGQLLIVATTPLVRTPPEPWSVGLADATALGGALAVLVIALGIMVWRVTKR